MPPTGPQCLLLVADPALAPLEPALVETLGRRHGGTVRWLADSAAVELALDPCPPRETLADLVERIADAGPGVQVVDIVLAEPRPGDDRLGLAVERARPVLRDWCALYLTRPERSA